MKSNDSAIQSAIYAQGGNALQNYDLLLNLECCLSFFLQLSMESEGAKMMVEYQVVRVLSSFHFLTQRPSPQGHFAGGEDGSIGLPTPWEKFQSI